MSISLVPPPAGINQPASTADVRLSRGLDAIGVQADFTAAPIATRPGGDDRHRANFSAIVALKRTIASILPSCPPALISGSVRLAGRNCPPRATTARRIRRRFRHAAGHPGIVAPIVFSFEWDSTQSTPSPKSTRLAPACATAGALRGLQDEQARRVAPGRAPGIDRGALRSRTVGGGRQYRTPRDGARQWRPVSNGPTPAESLRRAVPVIDR
jgi:hypothetical protein